jgi:hypothetical protein
MAALTWTANAAFVPQSSLIQQETCQNSFFDPGDTNTVQFTIKNDLDKDLTEVQFELLADGAIVGSDTITGSNIDFVLSAKTDKQNVAKKTSVNVIFVFRPKGECGRDSVIRPRMLVEYKEDGTAKSEVVTFGANHLPGSGQLGQTVSTVYTFNNTGAITINDFDPAPDKQGRANPYPSSVVVTGVPHQPDETGTLPGDTGERVINVAVTLRNVTHPTDTELAALLVGPRGQKVVLFRQAGGFQSLSGTTFTISGNASANVPLNAPFVSGASYKPADYASGDFPGVPGPYDVAASFTQQNANGTWQLYLIDNNFSAGAGGVVAGGWTLTLTTEKIVCCGQARLTQSSPSSGTIVHAHRFAKSKCRRM